MRIIFSDSVYYFYIRRNETVNCHLKMKIGLVTVLGYRSWWLSIVNVLPFYVAGGRLHHIQLRK